MMGSNDVAANAGYLPKQARALLESPGKAEIYNSTGGPVTAQFIAHNLTLIPSIPSGSVVHDNACGTGVVSRAILAPKPIPDIKIHATDIDPAFLAAFQADATKHNWAIDISNQAQESLTFEDNYFTHSINNIGIIFAPRGGLDGATEIFRTLRPGGTAVVNCWQTITWLPAFLSTNKLTRPGVTFPPPTVSWADGQQIQKIMLEAGFKAENMKVETSEAWAKTRDLRDWAEKFWAFLGGMAGWFESDEEKWDEAVDTLVKFLMAQPGTKTVGDEVWMRASQWVVVAKK